MWQISTSLLHPPLSFRFSVLVTNTTQHSDNTTQQSIDNVRRYSCAGTKIIRFCWLCWWRRNMRVRLAVLTLRDRSATVEREERHTRQTQRSNYHLSKITPVTPLCPVLTWHVRNNGQSVWEPTIIQCPIRCLLISNYSKIMKSRCCRGNCPSVALNYVYVNWRRQFHTT